MDPAEKVVADDENNAAEESDKPQEDYKRFYIEYRKKIRESKGFHVIRIPNCLNFETSFLAESGEEILQEVSEKAIEFFNKNEGSDFVFHSVVMGNYSPCAGRYYRITFRARPSNDTEDIKEFQVEARYKPWSEPRIIVHKCTVKDEREYPISFDDEVLREASEKALRFFNKYNEGSHFVLHSVVKGYYTPIVGCYFRVTFMAKELNDDADEDIKEFEAVVTYALPWYEYQGIIVLDCSPKLKAEDPLKPESESK